jgi:hypothetical protein
VQGQGREEEKEEDEAQDELPKRSSRAKIVQPTQETTPPPSPARILRSSPSTAKARGMHAFPMSPKQAAAVDALRDLLF